MKISTAKKVLHFQETLIMRITSEWRLKQVEKFKYLGVAFTDGRQDEELDTRIGKASSNASFALLGCHETRIVEKQNSLKAVFVPILTYGHESWVMTERMRSAKSEMRFLRRIEGVTLFNKVRSSEIENLLTRAVTSPN